MLPYLFIYMLSLNAVFPPPQKVTVTIPMPCGKVPSDMSCIPGGYFIRGVNRGPKSQKPEAIIYVETFLMDKTEVTAGAYSQCVKEGKCVPQRTYYKDFSGPKQPKVGISWFAAKQYCEVHGKRLPTESEWEKAARGPYGDQFPWGNAPVTCKLAVMKDKRGRGCGRKSPQPDKGKTWDVASKPVGRYGLYDMIGNADEWVLDWYSPSYYECGAACFKPNPKGPCDGALKCPGYEERVVKGGSWFWGPEHLYGSYRRPHHPQNHKPYHYHHFGFRCAKDVDQTYKPFFDSVNGVIHSMFDFVELIIPMYV